MKSASLRLDDNRRNRAGVPVDGHPRALPPEASGRCRLPNDFPARPGAMNEDAFAGKIEGVGSMEILLRLEHLAAAIKPPSLEGRGWGWLCDARCCRNPPTPSPSPKGGGDVEPQTSRAADHFLHDSRSSRRRFPRHAQRRAHKPRDGVFVHVARPRREVAARYRSIPTAGRLCHSLAALASSVGEFAREVLPDPPSRGAPSPLAAWP